MPTYPLNNLGSDEFEHLAQSLLKAVIGDGTTTFGAGADGAREATFEGLAPYPSDADPWHGAWIFQAKFHDTDLLGVENARRAVVSDVDKELEKIVHKYKHPCDNFILITNVPLSSVAGRGTHDRIMNEVAPKYSAHVRNVRVWGADEVSRFLEKYPHVRLSYMQFLTTGDVIAELLNQIEAPKKELAETIKLYLSSSFQNEQNAPLLQAGDAGEHRIPLQEVFIDLEVAPRDAKDEELLRRAMLHQTDAAELGLFDSPMSALSVLLFSEVKSTVLVGGPGQGKSTVGQYLAQIHRATLLNQLDALGAGAESLTPLAPRIPFRVLLKEYAQWLTESAPNDSLEFFLAERVTSRSGREVSAAQIQEILKSNPCLLVLDGLDEVMDLTLQSRMLSQVTDFLHRSDDVFSADIQVLAATRPTGYTDQFDPHRLRFVHLVLSNLSREKVDEYTQKWATATVLEEERRQFLERTLAEYATDDQLLLLMNTPLQVTVMMLIILTGGALPQQREALFHEYLEVIYKREKSKEKWVIRTDKEVLFGLHQYLGYLIYSRSEKEREARDVLTEEEFKDAVQTYLRHLNDTLRGRDLEEEVEKIVEEARLRLVLIVEPTPGKFGFELRSILEFFTAGHLNDTAKDSDQRIDRFSAIARQAYWRNVALFFAGRLARQTRGEAAGILQVCRDIDVDPPDKYLKRGVQLALDLAVDRVFGSHRNLQRSTVALALELLDRDLGNLSASTLGYGLTRLPSEDLRDFVIPELQERLERLTYRHLDPVIRTYGSLLGPDETLLAALDKHLQSSNAAEVLWAMNWCFNSYMPSDWLHPRLATGLDRLDDDDAVQFLVKTMTGWSTRAREALLSVPISEPTLLAALARAFQSPPSVGYRRVESTPWAELIASGGTSHQVALAISLRALLEDVIAELKLVWHRLSVPSYPIELTPLSGEALAVLLDRIAQIGMDHLMALADDDTALPHIRACAWVLVVLSNRAESSVLDAFVTYFEAERSHNPWLPEFFSGWFKETDQSLLFLLEAGALSEGQRMTLFDELLRLPETEDRLVRKLSEAKDAFADLDTSQKALVIHDLALTGLRLGDGQTAGSPATPQAVDEALDLLDVTIRYAEQPEQRRNGIALLIGTLAAGMTAPALSAEHVSTVISGLRRDMTAGIDIADAFPRLSILLMCNWGSTPESMSQLISLGGDYHRAGMLSTSVKLGLEMSLCERVLLEDRGSDEAAQLALTALTQNDLLRDENPSYFPDVDRVDLLLRKAGRRLSSPGAEVGSGALTFIIYVLRILRKAYGLDSFSYTSEFLKGRYWSAKPPRQLIEERKDLLHDGVQMLALSRISAAKDLPWILETMENTAADNTVDVWQLFLNKVNIPATPAALPDWHNALESILGNSALPAEVRFAALRRYEALTLAAMKPLMEREAALDLPLRAERFA